MTVKFYNPIGGRKKLLKLSSLFLFNIDDILKLSNLSMSGMMKEEGHESLYKRMGSIADEASAFRLAHDMVLRIPGLPKELIAAINGDVEAQAYYDEIGVWECFMKGYYKTEDEWPQNFRFWVEIERATYKPWELLSKQRSAEAITLLMESPIIQLLLWPEAIEILNNRNSLKVLTPLRGLIGFELMLSFLAGVDARAGYSLSRSNSFVLDVLPTNLTDNKNPTSLYFGWLKEQIGIPTISALLNDKRMPSLDVSVLNRWSSGSHMPSEKTLKSFLEAFLSDPDANEIWIRHYAAKYLNFIGYQAQKIQKLANTATTEQLKEAFRPWPDMPFGFKTIETWFENRYPYWFEYHSKQIIGEGIKPSPNI